METAKFYVGGEWCTSKVKRTVHNPFDGSSAGEVYQAAAQDIDRAIRCAVDAFPALRDLPAYARSGVLARIAGEVRNRKEQIARMMTLETGKPITLSRGEVDRAIFTFTTASEEAKRIDGTTLPLDLAPGSEGRFAIVRRFALGPIGAITPFNFPINLVAHKVGPALAVGCPIVLKPSSKAPQTALLLAGIIDGLDLPKGSFNVVPCLSSEGEQLITDERLKLITFTGSSVVGWGIKAKSGHKRVVLELGGNAGVIVNEDAKLDYAVARIVQGAFSNAGQSCISVQRVYVHDAVYDEFLGKLSKETRGLRVGDPSDEKTVVGPMIDADALNKVAGWIDEATKRGAKVVLGGGHQGTMLEPTIMTDVDPGLSVSCKEVFAPLVVVGRFTRFEDAVREVNNSSYGLQSALFTYDTAAIMYAYKKLEVGGVIVNDASSYRMDHMPYGGVKDSGFGREGVRYAMEEMTEMKLLALNF